MERIVVGRSATLTQTFTVAPTGTPTVAVTRSDGTPVSTGSVSGAGVTWSYTIPASSNTQLDEYTETWTATQAGEAQTYRDTIEVVGGFLFSIADLRILEPFGNDVKFPTATLVDARTMAEQGLEDACGVAFVPRYNRETITAWDGRSVLLSYPRPLTIRALSVDGTVWTQDQLDTIRIDRTGLLTLNTSGWCQWGTVSSEVVVDYEHGHSSVPLRVSRAAMLLVRAWLVSGPVDDRAATFSSVDGGTYSLVTAGRAGSAFGLPEVDAVVQQYGMNVGVA